MIIAVDFDGTVVKNAMPEIGQPVPGAFGWLAAWRVAGAELVLWTCRHNILLTNATKFLEMYNVKFDYINDHPADWSRGRKLYADLYIDDHGFNTPLQYFPGDPVPCVDWAVVGPRVLERITKGD